MAEAQSREWKIVGLMALGFGLVGIYRFLISPLFPTIAKELNLNYSDIGTIAGALALAWGVAALVMGNLSDRIGRRKVLVGALILFSLLIGASGLATGLMGLVLVRVVMGVADGAFTPPSISATLEASPPKRHGLNIGIQQMMLPLCGLALAPWLVGLLLPHMDWRWIFVLFSIPGFALAFAVWKLLPEASAPDQERNSFADWRVVLGYRNIKLLMVLMLCWLTCLVTTSALMPSYLIDFHGLNQAQMGSIMAAIGVGSTIGTLALPALSDITGRKPVMIGSTIGVAASLWMLAHTGNDPTLLFLWLGAVHLFNNACITLTVGPICAETVPTSLMATATGVVIACGELGGGGLAPIIAGQVADRFGIEHILWLPLGAMGIALVMTLFLKETRWSAEHGE
ncbi:MFS transporter [Sphingosinicella microcystinivorans]|uniref:3-(3-hydroxy-phenyl)propionate transporter MhpT n=1 Tax=Sphingosinicella microcystinivorans TaxID=335406 RepID=A0AAD1D6R7_SPHMI|nr:MFS transporter [Sphingosinicella microcystinivorans]RKS91774.1 putative MFS family arabinose efflux permease [Sphingosinicella microcystinivorans]BBE34760.1 3-(3-hydroxy-phenyl)propionate transporter MhpT [Sphingosinicella microcystinivorans]